MNLRTGFTLIELLVVISIIGLLSSIVLASLNTARTKAADANVMQQLSGMRTEASLIFSETETFDTVCAASANSGKMYRAAYERGTKAAAANICLESDAVGSLDNLTATTPGIPEAGKWAAVIQLKGGGYFCADYRGITRKQASRGIDIQAGPGGPADYTCD